MRLVPVLLPALVMACAETVGDPSGNREPSSTREKLGGTTGDESEPAPGQSGKQEQPEAGVPEGPFFGTAYVEDNATLDVGGSDGDLWPSCWSDDDALYTRGPSTRSSSTKRRHRGGLGNLFSRVTMASIRGFRS